MINSWKIFVGTSAKGGDKNILYQCEHYKALTRAKNKIMAKQQQIKANTSTISDNQQTKENKTNQEPQNLLNILSQVIEQKEHEEQMTAEKSQLPEIDKGLDSYVILEQSINQNPNLTDEQKRQARAQLWSDFDKYANQNPETKGRSR